MFSNQVYLLLSAVECLSLIIWSMIVKLTLLVKIFKTDAPGVFVSRCYFVVCFD